MEDKSGWLYLPKSDLISCLRPLYIRYVELKNKLAQLNGYNDLGDEWRSRYETDDFESDVLDLYSQLQPLYAELHAYIRKKLFEVIYYQIESN